MEKDPQRSNRIVRISDAALLDLANIDNTTAAQWGGLQADRYTAFLSETIRELAQHPKLGREVMERPGIFTFVAKYRKSRWAKGHRIVYVELPDGIRVIRILHTSMNWQDYLNSQ